MKREKPQQSVAWPQLVRVDQTAHMLALSEQHVYNALSKGTFPLKPVRIGRAIRFRLSDIQAFINQN